MKKNTAWYNIDILPNEMIAGANGSKGWPKLEDSEHFKTLKELISLSNPSKMADIGCGAGELGRIYKENNYVGYDLPHIIDKVARIVNPNINFEYFDAYEFDYTNFKKFDLLVCNGFISELTEPMYVIEKLINNSEKSLIIHRQFFGEQNNLVNYSTYGNLSTPRCIIKIEDLEKLLTKHTITKFVNGIWGDSVLIERI